MNPALMPDEIPQHPLEMLSERDYQDRYRDAICDYWAAVAQYLALMQRGGKPN